jgi:VCBS repeat-containing protein
MLKANAPTVDGFILSAQGEWSFDPQHAAYSKLAEGEMKTLSVALSVVEPDNQQADLVFEIFMVGGGAAPAAAQAAKI